MGVVRSYILVLAAVLISLSGYSQGTPEVHRINGEKYYLHAVEAGNTLYGISKQYNTTIELIEKHNPIIATEGLKVNQTILIPVTRDNKRELGEIVGQSEGFITHEVQKKETLYAISKKYNTSLSALLKANPDVEKEGLKAGSKVLVPIAKVEPEKKADTASAAPDSLESHLVKKGETLYSLSKLYDTSVEVLKKANNGLPFGLKEGMALRLPGRVIVTDTDTVARVDTASRDSIVQHVPDSTTSVSIGLLLPFTPTFPDSNQGDEFTINESQRVALSFYRGFKLAVDSLASKRNVAINLEVMDSGKDSFVIRQLITKGALDSLDVLVGPFYTDQFEMVADYTKTYGIPTICPIPKPSKLLFKRPNAIKTSPSESMQLDAIAKILVRDYRDSNVVVVNSNKFQDQENIEFFKSRYAKALNLPDTFIGDAIKEVKLWDITDETLTMRFPDSGSYVLVAPSSNKVFVTKLLTGLYNLQYETEDKYQFRVIGIEDWRKFEQDLDVRYLHALNVSLPVVDHIDYHNYLIRAFNERYRKIYGFESDRFALSGYDHADYLITQMAYNVPSWFEDPESIQFSGLMMNLKLVRVLENSGLENQSVELYEYDGYRLKPYTKWPIQKKK